MPCTARSRKFIFAFCPTGGGVDIRIVEEERGNISNIYWLSDMLKLVVFSA